MTETKPLQPENCDLLIVNGHVLTMDSKRTVFADGAVAIKGSRIVAVGPVAAIEKAWKPWLDYR